MVIGLTSTTVKQKTKTVELELIKALGFKEATFSPTSSNQPNSPTIDSLLEFTGDSQLTAHVAKWLERRPVLVYCGLSRLEFLRTTWPHLIHIEHGISDELLETLDQRYAHQNHRLCVATDTWAMRGLNYRGSRHGITLIILKSFACERDALQGLMRVGRFGDKCIRERLVDCPLVDPDMELRHYKRLFAFK